MIVIAIITLIVGLFKLYLVLSNKVQYIANLEPCQYTQDTINTAQMVLLIDGLLEIICGLFICNL